MMRLGFQLAVVVPLSSSRSGEYRTAESLEVEHYCGAGSQSLGASWIQLTFTRRNVNFNQPRARWQGALLHPKSLQIQTR
eukprot:4547412-Prymnesium_polylepis.1